MPKIPIVSSIPEDPQIKGLLEGYDKVPAVCVVCVWFWKRFACRHLLRFSQSPPLSLSLL